MHITTLWPDGSYCSQVARAVADKPRIKFRSSNIETIQSLKWQDFWVLPVSNKYGWVVAKNMETILDVNRNRTINVLWWYDLPIRHVLASKDWVSEEDIAKVFSHPQALLQCTLNLENLNAEQVATKSTTERIPKLWIGEAVICSLKAAQLAGLNIISDQFCPEDNVTSFAMLTSRRNLPESNKPKNCHTEKTISIIKWNPDIFPKIFWILWGSDIPVYFSEPVPNGKWWLLFPTVSWSFGQWKRAIRKKIIKLWWDIQVL